jgi:hypothetical protein
MEMFFFMQIPRKSQKADTLRTSPRMTSVLIEFETNSQIVPYPFIIPFMTTNGV